MNSEDEHAPHRLDLQFEPMDMQGLITSPYNHHEPHHVDNGPLPIHPTTLVRMPSNNQMQQDHHHHAQNEHRRSRLEPRQQAGTDEQVDKDQEVDKPDHPPDRDEEDEVEVVEELAQANNGERKEKPIEEPNDQEDNNEHDINEDNTPKSTSPPLESDKEVKRFDTGVEIEPTNAMVKAQQKFIKENKATTPLEVALSGELDRKNTQIEKLKSEVIKLKQFISKRKQTYKRKRKEDGAPTRALSAYNIFVQERFEQLAKENEQALMNADKDASMKRVPPSSLVAKTGHAWRALPEDEKKKYRERAKADKKRYNEQMAKYQPPEKQINKKRNKTGYNMFFSAHVNRLKDIDNGVPSERGSVARLVGNAWKVRLFPLFATCSFYCSFFLKSQVSTSQQELSADEKQFYEQQADNVNDNNASDNEDEEIKDPVQRQEEEEEEEYDPNASDVGMDPSRMPHAPVVHQPSQHDPRAQYPHPHHHPAPGHYPPYPYPYEYYPPMPPPPPGAQGRHPPYPYPHYPPPPPPYHEHHHHIHHQHAPPPEDM